MDAVIARLQEQIHYSIAQARYRDAYLVVNATAISRQQRYFTPLYYPNIYKPCKDSRKDYNQYTFVSPM